MELSRGVRK